MPYHQCPYTDHYKIERQLLNSRFPLLRIKVCKESIDDKTIPQRIYHRKQRHKR